MYYYHRTLLLVDGERSEIAEDKEKVKTDSHVLDDDGSDNKPQETPNNISDSKADDHALNVSGEKGCDTPKECEKQTGQTETNITRFT